MTFEEPDEACEDNEVLRGFTPPPRLGTPDPDQLEKLTRQLQNHVRDCYEPEITRWRRNYTARAEWFFLWSKKMRKYDQFDSMMLASSPGLKHGFYEKWWKKIMAKNFEQEYLYKFKISDETLNWEVFD